MIIVVAALGFETEADRDHAVAITADVQMATRVEEPGCHDYCFAPDPAVPTRIQVYELWEDSDSLAAHFRHPNYHKMVELLGAAINNDLHGARAALDPAHGRAAAHGPGKTPFEFLNVALRAAAHHPPRPFRPCSG